MPRESPLLSKLELELQPIRTKEDEAAVPDSPAGGELPTLPPAPVIEWKPLWSLAAQHLSSSWGSRAFEFASYLFLITIFPNTLLPASLFGFFTTGFAVGFSGFVGGLVDRTPRLRFVRLCIVIQKAVVSVAYALFLVLFLKYRTDANSKSARPVVWTLFALICVASCFLNLATIAINVSVERDWVTTIARGNSESLTRLNVYLRRIDLISKLLAPLFVSLLTTAASYPFATAFLLGYGLVSMVFEFLWIDYVYRRLPILAEEEKGRLGRLALLREAEAARERPHRSTSQQISDAWASTKSMLKQAAGDWREFGRSPCFPSSLAIALLYLTVLSFDGTLISWLKSHAFSDAFVAGMRGICVVTGLLGTVVMPFSEKKIGLVRTGTWSILSQVLCLVPVLLSFFLGAPKDGQRSSSWNAAMLFTGMALSRIGLWSFDVVQLKELQVTLQDHPRRNAITALQYSLQNILDLLKFVLTMILWRPSQFRWAALVSFISCSLGAVAYLQYSRQERGHLIHLGWTERLLRKKE